MSKIARYQGNVRAFASDARGMERTVFGGTNQADDLTSQITASFLRGWGIVGAAEHPSLEDFNAAMYAMSQFIAYQHQMGVPEWHAEQEYHIGSICTHNGESYQSLQNANVGSQPPSAKWTPVLTSENGLANLGLGETINRAADALQKSQNGADIPDKPLFVQNIGLKETLNPTKRVSIGNIGTGVFDGSTPCINIGDSDSGFIGSADGVLDIYCNGAKVGYIDGNGLHMLTDIHFDNARMTTNGDIFSSVWGNNWLSIWITNQLNTRGTIDWINSELAVRDNNINTRATWDYVNQTFARKNTGSIQDWGWILDDSTGFIMQWGTLGNSNGTYNFPRAFPVGCFAVFVTNTNAQGTQVDNAFGYPVSNSQFFAATKSSGMANLVNNFPVAWLALGR
ncbi:hypothetical protein ACFX2X_001292 [Salmonella enterica]